MVKDEFKVLFEIPVSDEEDDIKEYLNKVASVYPKLAEINVTGEYDKTTESAVKAFQGVFGINPTGVVTSTTWNILSEVYNAILSGENLK